jgi:hypothetical protein
MTFETASQPAHWPLLPLVVIEEVEGSYRFLIRNAEPAGVKIEGKNL